MRQVKQVLKENWIIAVLFLISTIYFITLHFTNLSWDFMTYILNAEYWAGDRIYYESGRAPLVPFFFYVFRFLGRTLAEVWFILSVSVLFTYSSVRLAKICKIEPWIFYALSLNSYVLAMGIGSGTELLTLALLELFIAEIIEGAWSGIFIGLAFLARHTILTLAPLVILHKRFRHAILSGFLFIFVVSP